MARINGTAGDDVLNGTDRRDIIDGGAGEDIMLGGLDHDTYYVDDANDTIIEQAGEGTDWIFTEITYTAPADVEHIRLIAKTGNFDLTGNAQDNTLIGNRGNNVLSGGGGSDYLLGGAGNDTYIVNNFALDGNNTHIGVEDVIRDTGGIDTVTATFLDPGFTDLTYNLQKGLENINFTGDDSTDMTVTGNAGRNNITTADGDDTIDGGRGVDTMDAGSGQNTFFIDHRLDVIIDTDADLDIDGLPDDSIADTAVVNTARYEFAAATEIEIIELGEKGRQVTGSDTNNVITGNTKANILRGGGGDDRLTSGGGNDKFYGDAGADTFIFLSDIYDGADRAPVVRIMDFNIAQGDALDFSDIISYDDGTITSAFVNIVDKGRDSLVYVNINESPDLRDYIHVATLVGVNGLTGEDDLLNSGNLILETA